MPILVTAILTALKLAQAAWSAKNKSDNDAVGQAQHMADQANQSTGQMMNKYFKDDLIKYMNFLKQNTTQQ